MNRNVATTKGLWPKYYELTKIVNREGGNVKVAVKKFRIKNRGHISLPTKQAIIKPNGYEPEFRYKHWYTNNPGKANANNCYSYSTGRLRMTSGNRSHGLVGEMCKRNRNRGITLNTNTRCKRMLQLILCDIPRAKVIDRNAVPKKGFHKVAVVFDKRTDGTRFKDYHFYRQHANGLWSHKSGWHQMPKLHDANNKLIFDPKQANRNYPNSNLNYNIFCKYIQVPSKRTRKSLIR